MRMLSFIVALALTGCTGGRLGNLESIHGYCGTLSYKEAKVVGCPTIDGDGEPMGYRKRVDGSIENMFSTYTDGSISGTGNAADILAEAARFEKLMLLCAVAPGAELCNGTEPGPQLILD